jgi:hypothetical protein
MRRLGFVLTMCSLFVVSSPAPARAMSWWALEKLTGPRFKGPVFDARIWCFTEPKKVETSTGTGSTEAVPPGLVLSLCNLKRDERRRASVDVNVGWFHSQRDDQFADGKEIKLIMLESSFSAHVWGPFEAGFALGMSWFSSEGLQSFRKFTLEPVRIDLRPIQWSEKKRETRTVWGEAIVVRVGLVSFPAGFEAAEFKYKRIPAEAVGYIGLFLDVEPLRQLFR